MKKLSVTLIVFFVTLLAVQAVDLTRFTHTLVSNSEVRLDWEVTNENGIAGYYIYRAKDPARFLPATELIPADGSLVYTVNDRPLDFGKADTDRTYLYQLYYQTASGDRLPLSSVMEVHFEFSTVTMTWGTLKALFR